MYNTDLPRRAELPSSASLLRSTALALAGAVAILVTVVLPADYGIDPTGAGRMLGLTDMGETKVRLAAEAEADRVATAEMEAAAAAERQKMPDTGTVAILDRLTAVERSIQQLVQTTSALASAGKTTQEQSVTSSEVAVVPADASDQLSSEPVAETAAVAQEQIAAAEPPQPALRSDSVSFTLTPGEGIEIKLVMKEGAQTNFAWAATGGPVNFDTHGDGPGGNKISYEKGRGVLEDQGTIVAAFDGNHGWFWRNRGKENVTLTLNTTGDYREIKGIP
jgi:hypothetical protein